MQWVNRGLFLAMFVATIILAGCAGNVKKVTPVLDQYGSPMTDQAGHQSQVVEYDLTDKGQHQDTLARVFEADRAYKVKAMDAILEATKCAGCSPEAKAWAGVAGGALLGGVVNDRAVVDVVEAIPAPKDGWDVLDNAVDRGTIPILAGFGVAGWITEALSGQLGTTTISSGGGALNLTDSLNPQEVHFTGSSFSQAPVEIPYRPHISNIFNGPVNQ